MDIADTILEEKKGNVVVLSDFIKTNEAYDPIISKRLLNARGNSVEFVNLASKANNIGFVNLLIQKDTTEATIKNYNEEEKEIAVSLIKENNVEKKESVKIGPRSKEKLIFQTLPGLSNIRIEESDDFSLDNLVYISSPIKDNIKILLITNNVPSCETGSSPGINFEFSISREATSYK